MDIASEHEIRQRAYEIWMASGMHEGEAEAHWLHAERAVRNEAEAVTAATPAADGKANAVEAMAAAKKTTAKTKAVTTKVVKANIGKAASAKAPAAKTAAPRRPKAGPVEAVA